MELEGVCCLVCCDTVGSWSLLHRFRVKATSLICCASSIPPMVWQPGGASCCGVRGEGRAGVRVNIVCFVRAQTVMLL